MYLFHKELYSDYYFITAHIYERFREATPGLAPKMPSNVIGHSYNLLHYIDTDWVSVYVCVRMSMTRWRTYDWYCALYARCNSLDYPFHQISLHTICPYIFSNILLIILPPHGTILNPLPSIPIYESLVNDFAVLRHPRCLFCCEIISVMVWSLVDSYTYLYNGILYGSIITDMLTLRFHKMQSIKTIHRRQGE